jgi:hypothetical protein
MITQTKLKIFKRYNGDGDAWARVGKHSEKVAMSDDDWSLIENFIQDIILVKRGLTSPDYAEKLSIKLNEFCETVDVIEEIKRLAETSYMS